MTIRAVLFDFDGTLADTLPVSFRAFQAVFQAYDNRDVTPEQLVSMFGPTEDEILLRNLGNKERAAEAIRDYYRLYREGHSGGECLPPDIVALLDTIRSLHIKMGVITGKSRQAYRISSEALDLDRYFEVVVTGDDVRKPKPDPEGIDKALAVLGVRREEAVFVGDSNADIAAGRAAGLRTYGAHWLSVSQTMAFELRPDDIFTGVDPFLALLREESGAKFRWLEWAKQIQAISQTGLAYVKDVYDKERYEALRELSVEIMQHYTQVDAERIRLTFASEQGYATPKVDVRGVVFHDNRILLVREKADGAWALPGGWADIGYSPSEVAVKEISEEAGYRVEPVRLLAVLDKKFHDHPPEPYHIYKIFIHCAIVGGEAAGGVETSEARFFGENELPPLSLQRNTVQQVKTMFEFLRNPEKQVILD
ncbi:NUDIX hydrolase N-terminal domain-containing protein [Paenibacillus allorhizosphaerae]|uniref:Pyrophosphatase PpaX n=1 Tax=Paenibacillus allorhizosphaerae TaxID=2849866 RepID=A0ABM8VPY3_9BACL|nr:NUDIX hydrolase N-terminal domain-containing protein [Paenibacillus allorhizosphaerae]CAG7653562.1 Pyrophosphatase PpaX [Paenibacillus allorhizosphaerae]